MVFAFDLSATFLMRFHSFLFLLFFPDSTSSLTNVHMLFPDRAVHKFDPERGYRLNTFAVRPMRQYVSAAANKDSSLLYVPPHVTSELSKMAKLQKKLKKEHGNLEYSGAYSP